MIFNPFQYLYDQDETMRQILDGRQVTMWTAIPGIVQSVNLTAMTCVVQPALQAILYDQNGVEQQVNLPQLLDVPIVFPGAGGFSVTFPMAAGDEVLVVFSSRCIDGWWLNGGYLNQTMEARMHDLSDGFAIPGPKSQPHVLPSINTTKLQIRNNAGTVYLNVGTKFSMTNAATSLVTILNTLVTDLNALATGLQANAGVETAAAASGVALAAALTTLSTSISALLET